jgi:glycosyltransferase involved in cell wall biosynthesis
MAAGIQAARGDIIVTMDGDLQNDPTDIPRMVELLRSGYDLVIGWRKKRKDEGPRVFVSRVANRIMAKVMGVAVKDSGCSLKAFRASLIQGIPIYGEMHRFIPALSQLAGARLMEIEVKHHPRRFGVSKYGFARIYRVMLDIVSIRFLLSYVRRPLAWHATFTAATFVVGAVIVLWSFAFGPGIFAPGNSLVEVSAGLLLLSLSLFLTAWGIIGQLFAFMDPSVLRFASMGSALSAKATPSADTVP